VPNNLYIITSPGPSLGLTPIDRAPDSPEPPFEWAYQANLGAPEYVLLIGVIFANGYDGNGGLVERSAALSGVETRVRITRSVYDPFARTSRETVVANELVTLSFRRYDWQLRGFELTGIGVFDVNAAIDPNGRIDELRETDNQKVNRFRIVEPSI
jgi:hypothetical protein